MFQKISDILSTELFSISGYSIKLENFIFALLIMILAPVLFWLFENFALKKFLEKRKVNEGRRFAITSLVKYFFYLAFFLLGVQALGINFKVIWAAGAALLLGIGLGLQQTFNDFASGIILLMEGSVEKGDWIKVGDMEGQVTKIGLRTSHIRTRSFISIIVPNSKITVDNVINYSHDSSRVRYSVSVGVAYGSDVKRVKELLIKCANRHTLILKKPAPIVRFTDFGDSALMFQVLFWCEDFHNVEEVRSDLRFMLDNEFRANKITIPFPQRDLHLVSLPQKFVVPEEVSSESDK